MSRRAVRWVLALLFFAVVLAVYFSSVMGLQQWGGKVMRPKGKPKGNIQMPVNRPKGNPGAQGVRPQGNPELPNIIFVLTDDFSAHLVKYMPHVQEMQKEGVDFSNFFVSNSLCCPSRASFYTGTFPHNHGVYDNMPPTGGYKAFNLNGNEELTFGVALQKAGYKTAMIGKYLNDYEVTDPVPMGWDEWAVAGGQEGYQSYHYRLNHNGTIVKYLHQPSDYVTDVLSDYALTFIRNASQGPYFIEIATYAPHSPHVPAPRHENMFPNLKNPRTPAYAAKPDAKVPTWLKNIEAVTVPVAKLKQLHEALVAIRVCKGQESCLAAQSMPY